MNEYVMTPDDQDVILGVTFEEEGNDAAIERAKEAMPGLGNVCSVWNLYLMERGDPEHHTTQDDKGGFYEVFVKQLVLDDVEEGTVPLEG